MDRLRSQVASLESGPELLKLRALAGPAATLTTDLDVVLTRYDALRSAISPVVTVAAVGIGAVAAVVLLMTGGLLAARRHSELALLRSRGGSLRGIGGRLLAETAVTAVPRRLSVCCSPLPPSAGPGCGPRSSGPQPSPYWSVLPCRWVRPSFTADRSCTAPATT